MSPIVQLHSTKPELRFCAGSNPARGVSELRDGEDLWQCFLLEIRLNVFCRATIPQKRFIIISSIIRFKKWSNLNFPLVVFVSYIEFDIYFTCFYSVKNWPWSLWVKILVNLGIYFCVWSDFCDGNCSKVLVKAIFWSKQTSRFCRKLIHVSC